MTYMRYVYAMVCEPVGDIRFVKFGITSSVHSRAATLQGGCPLYIEYALYYDVTNSTMQRYLEASLHCRYEDRISAGEWFKFEASPVFEDEMKRLFCEVIEEKGYSCARVKRVTFKRADKRRVSAARAHSSIRKAYHPTRHIGDLVEVVVGNIQRLPPTTVKRSRQISKIL